MAVTIQTAERTKVETLVESFDSDIVAGKSRLGELLELDPQSFQRGVLRVINSPLASSRGVQFAVGLLVAAELILDTLCDPSLNPEEAVALARIALQVDPAIDVTLAKKLADGAARGEPIKHAGRLMDVLGEISSGNRITSSLMRLWRSPDPQMRSKAVLLIGRSSGGVHWAQSRLSETDPRLRANALESLWGVDTAEAKAVLRAAASDGNNRVAGNAVFALYAMGDTGAITDLIKMAASDSPLFRSSAAWAMGETGDPRFSETLGRMMGESNSFVRKRAFADLARLKAAAKKRQGRRWRVAARLLPTSESMRQFGFEASPRDGTEPLLLLPTQFILSEDGRPVTQYQVEPYAPSETLAVTFLFPHTSDSNPPWVQGALGRLNRKRPSDLWCTSYYGPADQTAQGTPKPPEFNADAQAALAALQSSGDQTLCPAFWDAILNSAQAVNASERSSRHLIVYNQSSPAAPATGIAGIVSASVVSNTSVQVVSLTRCAPLEELCLGAQGSFQLASSALEASKLIEEAYLSLLARFKVSYQPDAPGARELNIRIFDPTGWGETTISLS
jgi:hypothetical protein